MSGVPFVDYIREFIAMNRPYDEWVKEMLSSSGPYWEEGNGGVGYFLRDAGMQLDNMSNTVRFFLGTSLECAQCHDHPLTVGLKNNSTKWQLTLKVQETCVVVVPKT